MNSLKLALQAILLDLQDTYKRSKMALLTILGILAIIEVKKIENESQTNQEHKEISKDQQVDANLANKESQDNKQADALVQEAKDLSKQEKPVGDDWNTK